MDNETQLKTGIGSRVRELRKQKALSQEQLAYRADFALVADGGDGERSPATRSDLAYRRDARTRPVSTTSPIGAAPRADSTRYTA